MADGVEFAGDGDSDISVNISGTNPGNLSSGGESVIEFAGDGAKDVDHANTPQTSGSSVPEGGPVEFVS